MSSTEVEPPKKPTKPAPGAPPCKHCGTMGSHPTGNGRGWYDCNLCKSAWRRNQGLPPPEDLTAGPVVSGPGVSPNRFELLPRCKDRCMEVCADRLDTICTSMRCWQARVWEFRTQCYDFFGVLGGLLGVSTVELMLAVCGYGDYATKAMSSIGVFLYGIEEDDKHPGLIERVVPPSWLVEVYTHVLDVVNLCPLLTFDLGYVIVSPFRIYCPIGFAVVALWVGKQIYQLAKGVYQETP